MERRSCLFPLHTGELLCILIVPCTSQPHPTAPLLLLSGPRAAGAQLGAALQMGPECCCALRGTGAAVPFGQRLRVSGLRWDGTASSGTSGICPLLSNGAAAQTALGAALGPPHRRARDTLGRVQHRATELLQRRGQLFWEESWAGSEGSTVTTEPCRSCEGTEPRSAVPGQHPALGSNCSPGAPGTHTALHGDGGCGLSSLGISHPTLLWGGPDGVGAPEGPRGAPSSATLRG